MVMIQLIVYNYITLLHRIIQYNINVCTIKKFTIINNTKLFLNITTKTTITTTSIIITTTSTTNVTTTTIYTNASNTIITITNRGRNFNLLKF